MKDTEVAEAIEELFKASGSVEAYPVFEGGMGLAPEVLSALECGMSTALVAASAIAKGETKDATPQQIAVNMKVTAVQAYVETVVLAENEHEENSEAEHGQE